MAIEVNDICEVLARKGTGTGACNKPLNARGQCEYARDHLDEQPDEEDES